MCLFDDDDNDDNDNNDVLNADKIIWLKPTLGLIIPSTRQLNF